MNSITAINTPSVLTMSSLQIAGLVEKRHDNVKRTVDTLVAKGIIVRPQIEDEQFFDTLGRSRSEAVYMINKRDSYVVVAQLSPEFTARLVDRWQELEEQAKGTSIALPDFGNPAIAIRGGNYQPSDSG
jgi:phage regulator Rha-like protein